MDILKEIIQELEKAKIDSVGTYRSGDYRIGLNKAIKIVNHKAVVRSEPISDVVKSFGCGWNFCNAVLDKKGVASCDKCNRYK